MSKEIDERVVRMRFDNQQFESGARETTHTLDGLRQALSFDNISTKGLMTLGEQVSAISDRFSVMGTIAGRVLERLADQAFNTGERIVKALTIQGAEDGYKEYELKMGSVQTIMNSSGKSLEEVNKVLDELNTYADRTIYSFSDMTSSIGKFTNAGVDLDKAVAAIQGISNEAALSGANANEASRAMYNFAQALSSGVVRLIDWKSIENANMATKEFKQQLIETAVELGTVTKEGDKYVSTTTDMNDNISDAFDAVSKFNDSLSAQWLTSDVLIKTLGKYADETTDLGKRAFAAAQEVKTFSQLLDTLKEAVGSGWAQSFEILVGDFEEAKKLWTGVNNVLSAIVDNQAKKRNELLQGWKDAGGRDIIIAAFRNIWDAVQSYTKPVKEALDDVFPQIGPLRLAGLSEQILNFTSHLRLSDEAMQNLHNTFRGVFSAFSLVLQPIKALLRVFGNYADIIPDIEYGFLKFTGKIGEFIAGVANAAKEGDVFYNAFDKAVQKVIEFVSGIIDAVKECDLLNRVFSTVSEVLSGDFTIFTTFLEFVKSHLPSIADFRELLSGIKEKAAPIADIFTKAGESVAGFFHSFQNGEKKLSFFEKFGDTLAKVWGVLTKVGGYIRNVFVKGFGLLGDAITNFDSTKLLDFVAAGSLFSATGGVIGFIHTLKETVSGFGDILGGVKDVLDGVTGTLETMQQKVKAKIIATIAGAVVGLAVALAVISALETSKLNQSLFAIGALFVYLGATFTVLGKLFEGKKLEGLKTLTFGMLGMAGAVAILSASMLMLKSFSWSEIFRSLLSVGLLMAELTIVAKVLSSSKEKMMRGAAGLIFFSAGIRVLTGALAVVKDLSWEEIIKGLTSVGLMISAVAVAINFTNFSGFGISQGLGLIALAAGIRILTGSVEVLSKMDISKLVQGLGAFVALLASLTIAMNFMPARLPLLGMGMMMFATGLLTISGALALIGLLDGEALARSVAVLGIALAGFVVAVTLMKTAIPGALAMLVVSAAIAIFVPAMLLLSAISWTGIAKGLVTLAGIFTVFGVAGLILAPMVPVILALAGALALIGVATLAAGAGLTMIGIALTSLGVGTATAAASIGAALTVIAVDIVKFIPTVLVAVGRGIIQMIAVIGDGAIAIGIAVIKIGLAVLNALGVLIPKVVEVALTLINAFLKGVEKGIPDIVASAFAVIVAFINALAAALRAEDTNLLAAIGNLISSIVELLLSALQMILRTVPVFGDQMAEALEHGKESVRKFFTPSEFSKLGVSAGTAISKGFTHSSGKFGEAADAMATDGLDTLKSYTTDFGDAGGGLAKAFEESANGGNAFGSVFSSIGNVSPTISPVLDMSELESSIGNVNGLFSGGSFTFAGYDDMMSELNDLSLGVSSFNSSNQSVAEAVDGLHEDNQNQNDKLDSMNSTLNQYLPYLQKFNGMQVTLDSGALVGQIKGPLDQELGLDTRRSVRSGKF